MNDNLEQLFDNVIAYDQKVAQIKAAKLATEQTEYEAKQRAEKQAREKEDLDKSFIDALRSDNIAGAKEALKDGADISYLDMGFDGKNEAYNSAANKAYYRCRDVAGAVKSADMAEFLLKDVMDMENPKHREVAQKILNIAFFQDEKSADKFIQLTKDNKLSLDGIMKEVVRSSHDIVGTYSKLIKAGANQEGFDFSILNMRYHGEKYGHRYGRDGDLWADPEPETAAQTKKLLLEIIKSGYKIDIEKYDIAKELAYEHAYEKFSEQDKKLITNLKSDNIEEIRKSLVDGRLPDNVEKYMKYVPYEEERGTFFAHYQKMMYDESGKERDVKPYTLENAERAYIKDAELRKLIEVAKFNPKGIDNAIADKFYDKFFGSFYGGLKDFKGDPYDDTQYLKQMDSKCQKAALVKITKKLDDIFKIESVVNHVKEIEYLVAFTMKLYNYADDKNKNTIRITMLEFRTSGNNEERRIKADMFKDALKRGDLKDNIQKDETIKAVSSISYTPLSSLNRQLMKHGKEIEGR